MFCTKCGAEVANTSSFCTKCGNPINVGQPASQANQANAVPKDRKDADKKMTSSHVLNIVAGALAIVYALIMYYHFKNNGISSETPSPLLEFKGVIMITILGELVLFALGIVIYVIKAVDTKKTLSLVYLLVSIPLCLLSVVSSLMSAFATCGLSFVLLACGIMQIVVGAKFYVASKLYDVG